MDVQFLSAVTVTVPRERILARLGYAKGITRLEAPQKEHIERAIEAGVGLISLQGCYRRFPVQANDGEQVVLSPELRFRSRSLGQLLTGCDEAMLMAATAGSRIMDAIHAGDEAVPLSRAVVFDAVASEMVESGLNWITELVNRDIIRQRRCFTKRRFSAGYGDLNIRTQKDFYTALRLDTLGVCINEAFLLIPEKTVTAIIGIRTISEPQGTSEEC